MIEKEILLEQTVIYLRSGLENLTQPNHSCRLMVDERCPPNAGEEFIGVYGGNANNINPPTHITKAIEHGLTIGITRRCIGIANEHAGENILTESQIQRTKPSLLLRARQIIDLMLAGDGWTLMGVVNPLVEDFGGCFLAPLGLLSIDPTPQQKGPEHWDQAEEEEDLRISRYMGLLLELQFGGAMSYRSSSPS